MDIGGFRDTLAIAAVVRKLIQAFTDLHSYDEPVCPGQPTLAEAGLADTYASAMEAAFAAYRSLTDTP